MLNSKEQMTKSLFPLFQNILRRINPDYKNVEITGNSKIRYLTYKYPNENYESGSIDGESCFTGIVLLVVFNPIISIFFAIPNVFWSNFCFYLVQIGIIIAGFFTNDTIKESITMVTITLVIMLLDIEIFYWISYYSLDMTNFHKNISALWPDFIFKFVFK